MTWFTPKSGLATRKTELDITGTIAANTNFSTTASGVSYTHSGDAGYILTSSVLFQASVPVQIEKNGIRLDKSDDVVWVNSATFQLNSIVDSGDKITIFS